MKVLLLCGFAFSLLAIDSAAQPHTIFLVRHAERAGISGAAASDTRLSAAGRARAQALANALKDATITAIYTTEYRRTQETAAPLANSLGIQPEVVSADDTSALIAKVTACRGNVLVVGHSNTLPQIIRALGILSRITIAEPDYDNLFLIIPDRTPQLVHLHYR